MNTLFGVSFFILFIVTIGLIVIRQISNRYKIQRNRLNNLIEKNTIKRIDNIKTFGREKNGWKNNFPSSLGWDKTMLQINKDFILVSGKSDFPFLFKSEIQPFIIATDPDSTKIKLNYDRVYKPFDIKATNNNNDLELSIKPKGTLGKIKVHLTYKNIGKQNLDEIFKINNWH